MIINNEDNLQDIDDDKRHKGRERGGGGIKKEKAVCYTSVENCLVTFYSFVKVVSIFVYYS